MCGIVALVSPQKIKKENVESVKSILRVQYSRGPDSTGFKVFENCVLGHNRLSIIDLSTESNQPMKDNKADVWIVFNGEVFNFVELKDSLRQKGYSFSTQSDTEVLLKLYLEYGEEMVQHINGQFAFVIFDVLKNKVFIARDRLGIIPLYYYQKNKIFLFASSFKALINNVKVKLSETALAEYLLLRCVLPPHTLYKDIYQLEPGHYLVIQNGKMINKKYWHLCANEERNRKDGFERSKKKLYELMSDSTQKRLVADVPVGMFLSGGLDSSIICKLASRNIKDLKTYSIRFSEFSNSENDYSRYMAKICNTQHSIYDVKSEDVVNLIDEWVSHIDHPSGARDMFAMYLLSKFVKEKNPEVKVILTGTGSDELFNGYMNSYFSPTSRGVVGLKKVITDFLLNYGFTNKTSLNKMKKVLKFNFNITETVEKVQAHVEDYLSPDTDSDPLNLHNFLYVTVHLAGWELPVADNMAMTFSLETRTPFLDHRFVEYAFSLPGVYKYKKGQEKFILRETFKKILPQKIYKRQKEPFSRQVMDFLSDTYLEKYRGDYTILSKYIDLEKIKKMNIHQNVDFMWRVLVLEKWLKSNNCN